MHVLNGGERAQDGTSPRRVSHGLVDHDTEFNFYPKCNGTPFKSFKQRSKSIFDLCFQKDHSG